MDTSHRGFVVHVFDHTLLVHAMYEGSTNREELNSSHICACFHCERFFFPEEIKRWTDKQSAICPLCGKIAVLPDVAHLPLTPGFLKIMRRQWFSKAN